MTKTVRMLLVVAAFAAVITGAAHAQAAGVMVGDTSPFVLYGLGLVNTLLMAMLIYHMNGVAKARAQRDVEINDALKSITIDLRVLNDAVLSQYVTEEQFKAAIDALRAEQKDETSHRREADHDAMDMLHKFELALTAHQILKPGGQT